MHNYPYYNRNPDHWLIEVSGIPFGLPGQMLEGGRLRGSGKGVEERHPAFDDLDRSGRLGRPAGGFGQLDSFIGAV